mgnify:CR=1 FL=1
MRKLIIRYAIPLTLISFSTFTKWWFVLPVDAPSSMMTGFPIPFLCNGWHTSMSYQIFILELFFDLLFYLTCWTILLFMINRFKKIPINRYLTISLFVISGLSVAPPLFIASMPEHIFTIKRDFDIQVLDSGFRHRWMGYIRPDLEDYVLVQKDYKQKLLIDWNNQSIVDNEVKYVKSSSNPYLGGCHTCKRVDRIPFIDTLVTLDSVLVFQLVDILTDSNNIRIGSCEPEFRFIASKGFLIMKGDTLLGTINMTYDSRFIEFEPRFRDSTSWTLTDVGLNKMEKILNGLKK